MPRRPAGGGLAAGQKNNCRLVLLPLRMSRRPAGDEATAAKLAALINAPLSHTLSGARSLKPKAKARERAVTIPVQLHQAAGVTDAKTQTSSTTVMTPE